MNRGWRIFAAAGMVFIGCSKLTVLSQPPVPFLESTPTPKEAASPAPGVDLSGLWRVDYSWGCASRLETTWILRSDGTFASPAVNQEGIWSLNGQAFELIYPYNPRTVYTGTLDPSGDDIEGTMAANDGSRGCWHAHRQRTD
jgi:hypothetical protein